MTLIFGPISTAFNSSYSELCQTCSFGRGGSATEAVRH
jgi:hypothetical protein